MINTGSTGERREGAGGARSLRCAVYTRKSSEEGLEQAFNSLDAQREAGQDYIKSQRHQGWTAIKTTYDDGGYSGGSTDRPGLQRLLADIQEGRVDVVVVYKVDRLSRSLADFARLMQVFDEKEVSFASVTQQFNTTTSMGRLTLNMLLSFAQFEREVTGERIRDKIAATKRKGVWVGGRPPLGYRIPTKEDANYTQGDRVLRIEESEAALVRAVFAGYLKCGSLMTVAKDLNTQGHHTRVWTGRDGTKRGGNPLDRIHLYYILTNPLYIGKITHRRRAHRTAVLDSDGHDLVGRREHHAQPGDIYDGLHEPIIDRATWDKVQAKMASIPRSSIIKQEWNGRHLLKGKLRTSEGSLMSPSWAQRKVNRQSRATKAGARQVTLYYVSQKAIRQGYAACPIRTINAHHIDDLVRAMVIDHCKGAHQTDLATLEVRARDIAIRSVVNQVTLGPDMLTVDLQTAQVSAAVEAATASRSSKSAKRPSGTGLASVPIQVIAPTVSTEGPLTRLTLKVDIRRFDNRRLVVSPDGRQLYSKVNPEGGTSNHEHIRLALGLAYAWHKELLESGESITSLARRYKVGEGRVHTLLALTHLSPSVIGRAMQGLLPGTTNLGTLLEWARNLDWHRHPA